MKRSKKILSLMLVMGLMVSSLTGCSSSKSDKDSEGKTKIVFQMGTAPQENITAAFEQVTEKFESENPDIDVELLIGANGFEETMKTKMAANDLPDLWTTHGWSVNRYSEYLRPLNDREWVQNISEQIKPVITNKEGEIFVLPTDMDIAGIAYNQDVLDKAGIKVDDIKTWDDFYKACDAVKAQGISPIHVGGKETWTVGNIFEYIAPPVLVTDENNNEGEALKDGSFDFAKWTPVVEMLENMNKKEYFNVDKVSSTYADTSKVLAQGQAAFAFVGSQAISEAWNFNPDAKLGFMPVPAYHEGDEPTLIAGEKMAIGVWKDTKHEEEVLKYIDFLAQPENVETLASANIAPAGLTNSKSDLGKLSEYYDKYKDVETVPYFDREYLPSGMWETLCSTGTGILTNQLTVKQAVEQAKSNYDRLR
ncbi:ABC transporter substrate-binding protein [Clostridium sp.]|uniref:ABC transporter substrate-binding protein n=1 Tax=Clostridium sp. TaxID=1506 RepID=UPI003F311343